MSVTALQGVANVQQQQSFSSFRNTKPTTILGNCIYVFDGQ